MTMRYDNKSEGDDVRRALESKVDKIFFTGRKAKRQFLYNLNIYIHVWIDDLPEFILQSASS